MKILAIETSCDETGISIIDAEGSLVSGAKDPDRSGGVSFALLADTLTSQAELHSEYGGVYPTLAKREHAKALPLLLEKALRQTNVQREPLDIDAIAVTHGPGLEPALWTGITFARELATKWGVPIVPVNHMEGHIYSTLLESEDSINYKLKTIKYPAIALLISGGHTDMVLIKAPFDYEYLGGTLDDAVGEAFDKVARMLGLGYPGGPIISKLAQEARERAEDLGVSVADPGQWAARDRGSEALMPKAEEIKNILSKALPRPMLHSGDYNFSFSGLKTAVLYKVKEIKKELGSDELPAEVQREIAREFEDACAEVLASKVGKAMQEYGVETLIIGGGVAANSHINTTIKKKPGKDIGNVEILTPYKGLSGDNALMIAIAGYLRAQRGEYTENIDNLKAQGTLKL